MNSANSTLLDSLPPSNCTTVVQPLQYSLIMLIKFRKQFVVLVSSVARFMRPCSSLTRSLISLTRSSSSPLSSRLVYEPAHLCWSMTALITAASSNLSDAYHIRARNNPVLFTAKKSLFRHRIIDMIENEAATTHAQPSPRRS